jgi:hypothetical protein
MRLAGCPLMTRSGQRKESSVCCWLAIRSGLGRLRSSNASAASTSGPSESSDIRRRELTKSFAERYGDVPIIQVGDEIVADWLTGGGRAGPVQGLCSMFNDAASVKAGRLIDHNPFQEARHLTRQGPTRPATTNRAEGMRDHRARPRCPLGTGAEGEFCRFAAGRALDPKLPRLPLEGRQSRRRMGRQSLPFHPPLRGLVHGQRA